MEFLRYPVQNLPFAFAAKYQRTRRFIESCLNARQRDMRSGSRQPNKTETQQIVREVLHGEVVMFRHVFVQPKILNFNASRQGLDTSTASPVNPSFQNNVPVCRML
jgi:hypothetical protein